VHTPPGDKGKAAAADDAREPSVHDRIKRTPRRGGRFNPEHDRGLSPEPPGTRMFSREIRTAPFPPPFRQPTTLVKYSSETDPAV
jgi:hypothetical protein